MTSTPSPDSSQQRTDHDLPALLDDGLSFFEAAVRTIEPDDWDKPTPCDGWTVRDLVGHVVSTMTAGGLILRGEPVPPSPERPGDAIGDATPQQVATRVEELARGFRSGLDGVDLSEERETPMGPRSMSDGLAFPVVDLAVHTWDLHTALGTPTELPTPLLSFAHSFSTSVPESVLRNPRAFGPAVEAAEDASPTEQLMAYLGRSAPRRDGTEDARETTSDQPTPQAADGAEGGSQAVATPTKRGPMWPDEQPEVSEDEWARLGGEATSGSSQWVVEQLRTIDEKGTTEAVDIQGMPVVVLTMMGRRSGTPRRVPLMRVEHEGIYAAVASKGGAPEHPQWYHNLVAHPAVLLQDGTKTSRRIARVVEGAERSTWWARCVGAFPPYAEYEVRAGDRDIPVFLLEPVAGEEGSD